MGNEHHETESVQDTSSFAPSGAVPTPAQSIHSPLSSPLAPETDFSNQPDPSLIETTPASTVIPQVSYTDEQIDPLSQSVDIPSTSLDPQHVSSPSLSSFPPPSASQASGSTSRTSTSLRSSSSLSSSLNSPHQEDTPSILATTPEDDTLSHRSPTPVTPSPQKKTCAQVSSKYLAMASGAVSGPFRARPLPASTAEPNSSPRMSKAAMLRLGIPWTAPVRSSTPHADPSHPPPTPRFIPTPASLNPPTVAPRATRASALRTDGPASAIPPAPRVKRSDSEIFENTPGHSFRRHSLITPIASIAEPKQAPRPTRASALRAGQEPSPNPGSSSRRAAAAAGGGGETRDLFEGTPGHPRAERIEVKATAPPELEVRPTRASMLRTKTETSHNPLSRSTRSRGSDDEIRKPKYEGGE